MIIPERSSAQILYVTALSHEAKPLYGKLNAKLLISKYGFKLYHTDDENKLNNSALLVTGSGSNAMSSGLTWAQQYLPDIKVFLNVGIAGHGSLTIGSNFLVSKVCDDNTGKCFYPHPIVKKHREIPFSDLLTVAKPSDRYQPDLGYDMEASAFFETGRRFLNAEAVQSIKIVSDNTGFHFSQLTPKRVFDLIDNNSQLILSYSDLLLSVALPNVCEFDCDLMNRIQSKWTVSVSNQVILQELLRSAVLLAPHSDNDFPQPQDSETLKQYLSFANNWIQSIMPKLTLDSISNGKRVPHG